jgi:hypothetical protein
MFEQSFTDATRVTDPHLACDSLSSARETAPGDTLIAAGIATGHPA